MEEEPRRKIPWRQAPRHPKRWRHEVDRVFCPGGPPKPLCDDVEWLRRMGSTCGVHKDSEDKKSSRCRIHHHKISHEWHKQRCQECIRHSSLAEERHSPHTVGGGTSNSSKEIKHHQ